MPQNTGKEIADNGKKICNKPENEHCCYYKTIKDINGNLLTCGKHLILDISDDKSDYCSHFYMFKED